MAIENICAVGFDLDGTLYKATSVVDDMMILCC